MLQSTSLIEKSFCNSKGCFEEPRERMKVPIDNRYIGANYCVFSFDKNLDAKLYPKGLFPFLEKIKGAHSVCDYMLWVQKNGQTYIILIELKKGKQQAGPQLRAGRHLAEFIVHTFNRINNLNLEPKIRMVSIHNTYVRKKGPVRMKAIEYDSEDMAEFRGNTFCIADFIK